MLEAFDGENLERKVGQAYLLVTTDLDGAPRPCMLSAGEILAPDDRTLRVALWPGTSTSENLARGARALFCHVTSDAVLYVKGRSTPRGRSRDTGLEAFAIHVETVESDEHKGMPVTTGIRFTVVGMDQTLVVKDWTRRIEALRRA